MKLSIIVPVYKVEPCLRRCVDSILAQTFTDFELILVDDGSPDGCPAICDEYARLDERVRVIHKSNGGLSDARNAGLDVARGEFIGFVDSDDSIHPCMYMRLMEQVNRYNADMAVTGFVNIDESGEILKKYPKLSSEKVLYRKDFIDQFYPDNKWIIFASACNKLYRRELFHGLRYPVGKLYEDSFVQLPLYDRCQKIVVDAQNHYFYYSNREGSIMNSSYSEKKFQLIDLAESQYRFFETKGLRDQKDYALDQYVNNYMINFFAVHIMHHELKAAMAQYDQQFNCLLLSICKNPKICKMKKLVVLMMYLNAQCAYTLCKRFFPECLPDFLR